MADNQTTWQPLLDGSLRRQAIQKALEIADLLENVAGRETASSRKALENPSLAKGKAGFALMFAYIDPQGRNKRYRRAGLRYLDEALVTYLDRTPWQGQYDLISGLVGIGVYGLERRYRGVRSGCLAKTVDRLYEMAEWSDNGLSWFTSPSMLSERQRDQTPGGRYNLGVAHGVPGVIGLLGEVCSLDVESEKAWVLLEGAVKWLLLQAGPAKMTSMYPNWIALGSARSTRSRLAWCYGDLGIAVALLGAARRVNQTKWASAAVQLARKAARRPLENSHVVDAGLCHGAAGVAHLFNRLYQTTGDELFRRAAWFWFEYTLSYLKETGSRVSDLALHAEGPHHEREGADDTMGFLTGLAGVALALHAAASAVEPNWDRVLLSSIPK